jgi:hypothetical protein
MNVWATSFSDVRASKEYPKVIPMFSFESLIKGLCDENICEISKLAIHTHGATDSTRVGGFVDLKNSNSDSTDMIFSINNMHTYEGNLKKLETFLKKEAYIIFFSCGTGYCDAGDQFLIQLSKYFPGRTVIAFTTFLYQGKAWNQAGKIQDTREFNTSWKNNPDFKNFKLAMINLDTAKWAKGENIVKPAKKDCVAKKVLRVPVCDKEGGKLKYNDACSHWKKARVEMLKCQYWRINDQEKLQIAQKNKKKEEEEKIKKDIASWDHNLLVYNKTWDTIKSKYLEKYGVSEFTNPPLPNTKKECEKEIKSLGGSVTDPLNEI